MSTLPLTERINTLKDVLQGADSHTKEIISKLGRLNENKVEVTETTDYCPGWGEWSQWAQWFN